MRKTYESSLHASALSPLMQVWFAISSSSEPYVSWKVREPSIRLGP